MKGRKRTLRKGLSGKILSFTMALAMVTNLMGGYCAATELSTKEVKAADAEQPPYRNVMYYGDWSIYSGQKNFTPDKIDGSLITHLNFAFMDADANGAYNIARKGLMFIDIIKETEDKNLKMPKLFIKNKDWLNYVQKSDL